MVMLAGLVGAVAAVVVWLLLGLMLPLAVRILMTSSEDAPVAAPFGGESLAVAAVVGFAAGVFWKVRRPGRRPA